MFGNILIDKFRCYMPLKGRAIEHVHLLKTHVEDALKRHFAQNAYFVTLSKKCLRLSFEFNPTRYFDSILGIEKYTDTNMDMPEENKILELFEEIFSQKYLAGLFPYCKITKIDLTKNFLMQEKIFYYLEVLLKRTYNKGYRAITLSGNYHHKTVSITTLARNTEKQDKTGDRELICYGKVEELIFKHIDEIILKKSLSDEEQNMPNIKLNYNKSANILKINDHINILRLEWQLSGSSKIFDLSKNLGFEREEEGLYLEDLYSLLQQNKLYQSLDNYYTKSTLEVLKAAPKTENKKPNIYTQILSDYYDYAVDLPLKSVFKDYDLYNKYNKILLEIQKENKNKLFKEIIDNIAKCHNAS